jgi:hypothetical protein
MLRGLRWLFFLALGGGLAYYLVKVLRGDPAPVFSGVEAPAPVPTPAPAPTPAPTPTVPPWVEATDGPPGTHPVKAKMKSGIYHLPGMLNYERTVPDRWYRDAAAAEADGLRAAKR